jgi:hypothetical protein
MNAFPIPNCCPAASVIVAFRVSPRGNVSLGVIVPAAVRYLDLVPWDTQETPDTLAMELEPKTVTGMDGVLRVRLP